MPVNVIAVVDKNQVKLCQLDTVIPEGVTAEDIQDDPSIIQEVVSEPFVTVTFDQTIRMFDVDVDGCGESFGLARVGKVNEPPEGIDPFAMAVCVMEQINVCIKSAVVCSLCGASPKTATESWVETYYVEDVVCEHACPACTKKHLMQNPDGDWIKVQ